jgi:hypothetical protein
MAIQGIQNINIGLPNESANSDSLYDAFNKTKNNFANLFANASPVPVSGNGITITQVSNTPTISANLVAGNNVIISNVNGAIRIDSLGDPANGTVTGVIAGTGLTGGGFSGNITLGLSTTGVVAAQYTNPIITVDSTGRIISASSNAATGTVTSVGLAPGAGIQVTGGPVTSAGTITVTNTGVTRLNAGTGITVSSSNGNVTISSSGSNGTVTSVGVTSSQLVVSGSPVIAAGIISVDLPNNATFSGNVVANRIVANSGQINGNLVITGNISPASVGKIGGIQPGPGIEISESGLLTIDNANLPISFGDFFANNNILSIVNEDEDMILQTQGNAEIQLIGNIGFYKPDGIPPNVANRYFSATSDGQIAIFVSNVDPVTAAVKIVGSSSLEVQSPINTGVMLHVTGQNDDPSRIYNDAVGGYAGYIARRYNGTALTPTQVLDGDEIARLGVNAYTDDGWISIGQARISFVSTDNQSNTLQGSKIEFWSTPKGETVASRSKVLELDASFGANVIGNINATGNIFVNDRIISNTDNVYIQTDGGNSTWIFNSSEGFNPALYLPGDTGVIVSLTDSVSIYSDIDGQNGIEIGTGDVTTIINDGRVEIITDRNNAVYTWTFGQDGNLTLPGNILSSGAITSNSATAGIGYSAGAGGTITQNNSKSDPVTLDKITGEITMNGAQLNGDSTVSFTLNNTTIANTDVIILNQVSDANVGLYSFNGKCDTGNAKISVHNMTNTNRSDAIVIRFAVIKAAIS